MEEFKITFEEKHLATLFVLAYSFLILFLNLGATHSLPISFGDEGFHSFAAFYIAKNLEYPAYFKEISGNNIFVFERPPFWNIFEASFIFFLRFIDKDIIIRTLTPTMVFLTSISVYILTKRIFNKFIAVLVSVLIISFPSMVIYSITFYTDALATFFYSLFFLTFLLGYKENNRKLIILSSAFAALSFLTKFNSIVLFAFYPIVFLYDLFIAKRRDLLRTYLICFIFFLIFVSGYLIRNFIEYGTPICREIPFISKFLSTERCNITIYKNKYDFEGRTFEEGSEMSVFKMGIINYLDFAYGNLPFLKGIWNLPFLKGIYLPLLLFIAGLLTLWYFREKYFSEIIFLNLLLFLLIFFVSTSRAEDTARYTLIFLVPIALVAAIFLNELVERKIFSKKNFLIILISVFLIFYILIILQYKDFNRIIFTSILFFPILFTSIYFYQKKKFEKITYIIFIGFVSISIFQSYYDKLLAGYSFKRFSSLFFEACNWVKKNLPEDSRLMTIWSYRAIYNCERSVSGNIADISVSRNLNVTLEAIRAINITHIFIQKFSIGNRDLAESQNIEFVRFLDSHPEYFEKIYENPENDTCFEGCLSGILISLYGRCPCDGNIIYKVKLQS